MNNILIYSDLHINQSSVKECIMILEEIGMLANKYDIDTLINLGDTFDNIKPSSLELDIFATFINRLKNKKHIIIAANSHESTTEQQSIINHFGILSSNVQVVKEYKDQNHLYCGHFSIKESSSNYDAKLSKTDLKDYMYVFLGHIHSYQVIKPNICHLGSSRYVNFDEAKDGNKVVAIISDYDSDKENVHFLKLKSPIPMVELELQEKDPKNSPKEARSDTILGKNEDKGKDTLEDKSSISQAQNPSNLRQIDLLCQKLDKLEAKTKVKVKIMDFESLKQFLSILNKYSKKFTIFRYETKFIVISNNTEIKDKNEIINFKESLKKWLNKENIDKEIKQLIYKELEND